MSIIVFLKGLLIGAAMAVPIGPLSILCIRRSLTRGHHAGLATALGVALADGFYATVAALGLTAISSFLLHSKLYLYFFGGTVLLLFGYKAFTAPPVTITQPIRSSGFIITLIQTIMLTLANPMTIVSFIAAFAWVGFEGKEHSSYEALILSFGVFMGSALWFMFLSTIISLFRKRVTPKVLTAINKISGIFLMVFGALFLIEVARILYAYRK